MVLSEPQKGVIDVAPMSEARRRANEKYNAKAYDEIKTRVAKGKKEMIRRFAQTKNKSLNSFINEAIDEKIEREKEI